MKTVAPVSRKALTPVVSKRTASEGLPVNSLSAPWVISPCAFHDRLRVVELFQLSEGIRLVRASTAESLCNERNVIAYGKSAVRRVTPFSLTGVRDGDQRVSAAPPALGKQFTPDAEPARAFP